MKSNSLRLKLEILEGRDVPGFAPPAPMIAVPHPVALHAPVPLAPTAPPRISFHAPIHPPVRPPVHAHHALATVATGYYICTLRFASTNTGYHFTGSATVKSMGWVFVQADIYAVGYSTGRGAYGQITFSNAHGSVTIKLTGPSQPKLSPLPSVFHYKVLSTTGAYRHIKDSGQLRLTRMPDRVPVRFGLRFFETGNFRILIG